MRAAVLGLGSWGTALARRAGMAGHDVAGWTHDPEQRKRLAEDGENKKYLPGVRLLGNLRIAESIPDALGGADVVVLAVPTFAVREVVREVAGSLTGAIPVINTAKGLEQDSRRFMLQVLSEELGEDHPAVSLVGPSHAEEVGRDFPTAVVAASRSDAAGLAAQDLLADGSFRIYTNRDVLGVELAAALKNVIALAAGISAGLGYGDNTLGALITRGMAEMTRLGVRMGAQVETFFGLSGVGDLVTTCVSPHSRNRRVGEAVGRGQPLEDVLAGMTMVAEGVSTTRAAGDLAGEHGVEMPIVERVHAVLFAGEDPRTAIQNLMSRVPKAENPAVNRA